MSSAPIYHSLKIHRNKTRGSGGESSLKSAREEQCVPKESLSPTTTKKARFDSHQTSLPVLDHGVFSVISDNGSPDEGPQSPPTDSPQVEDYYYLYSDFNLVKPTNSNDASANAPVDWKDRSFQPPSVTLSQNVSEILNAAKEKFGYDQALKSFKGTNHEQKIISLFKIIEHIFWKLIERTKYEPSSLEKKHPFVV